MSIELCGPCEALLGPAFPWPLPQPMPEFKPGQGPLRRVEGLAPVQGASHPLHATLVLFHEMVEILALTEGNRRTLRLVVAPDRRGLGFTASNGDRFWHAMAARFGEQALQTWPRLTLLVKSP